MNTALRHIAALLAFAALPVLSQGVSIDPAYVKTVKDWRIKVEQGLKRDNGWLTLAGRFSLKQGENTFGTGKGNDIVFPAGLGPAGMGSVFVEPGKVSVKLVEGFKMKAWDGEFSERVMGTAEDKDWVSAGRAAFQIIERNGRHILRLADNQSEVRKSFDHRAWYDVDDNYRVSAKYTAYDPPRKIAIVNVLDEVSDEPAPGYVEFEVFGRKYRLDVVGDDDGLFMIFKDNTAGETTYGSGRFLYVEEKPATGAVFKLDLNKAYNPPCAFSEFTTCPLPPKQNILNTRIEAGEKYPPLRKAVAAAPGTPARAAIMPFPSTTGQIGAVLAPAPTVTSVEPATLPKVTVDPRTGSTLTPSGSFAVDSRTGRILHETGSGYIDPQTGRTVTR